MGQECALYCCDGVPGCDGVRGGQTVTPPRGSRAQGTKGAVMLTASAFMEPTAHSYYTGLSLSVMVLTSSPTWTLGTDGIAAQHLPASCGN